MSEEQSRRVVDLPRAPSERRGDEPPLALPEPRAAEEPTLADYLEVLRANRWLIAAVAGASLALGGLYLLLAPPTYRADVLIQVEEKSKGLGGIDELSTMLSEKTPAETEMEILRSRLLAGAVVDQVGLDREALPRRFPLVGGALARLRKSPGPAPALFGLSSFAWGGERIRVDRLSVGDELLEERLSLVVQEGGRYRVLDGSGRELAAGEVGLPAAGGDGDRRVELFVSELVARSGSRFVLRKVTREDAVERLQKDLRISEKGKKTGIIVVALEGYDPERITATLDAVAQTYLRQNVERKSAEAEKTLQFIESQLPLLKENLDQVESALNTYKQQKRSVDLSLETKGALDRAVEIEKGLTELSLQQSELRQRFTESHPALVAVRQKREKLLAEKATLEQKLKGLPEAELESARLIRDVKTASELYFLLLNRAQELRVVKSGTIGNVRIVDTAVQPRKPVSPRAAPTLALCLLLGLALGVGAAFVGKALDHGVDDPDAIERATGVPVYASVPHSATQVALVREMRRQRSRSRPVLADHDATDLAVEAIRSLRTALQFSLVEARSNVIAVVGAAPGVGKSFVAVNLAHVMADAGKRVLLVDADLRRGHLHHYLGGDRERGLSELVAGGLGVEEAVRRAPGTGVDFVTSGVLPPNPSELLASERFKSVLGQLSARYDVVLLDTAPILAVTDAAVAGRLAAVSLLVLRARSHPLREIALAAKRFRQNGVPLHGVVLNDVRLGLPTASRYHYQYEYRTDE
jgi:tyrosine-protein kinase Etk/Wzc